MSHNLLDFGNDDDGENNNDGSSLPPPPPSSLPPPPTTNSSRPGRYIIVPQRVVNLVDIKFEEDPFLVTLHGIMTPDAYKDEIKRVNAALHDARATYIDHALLFSGAALLPLIPWAIRSKRNKKKRRRILEYYVDEFNSRNPSLRMIWQSRPEKILTIWLREDADTEMRR